MHTGVIFLAFADMYTKACRKALRSSKRDDPRLLEAYRITLGLRNCAESLIALLPYTDRFQAMLSQGESPAASYRRCYRFFLRCQVKRTALKSHLP